MNDVNHSFLIVGHGHAGSKYSQALVRLEKPMRIVDPVLASRETSGGDHEVFRNIPLPVGHNDVAILATHAALRKRTLVECLNKGYRNVIIEKLVASSLRNLAEIEEALDESGAKGLVHNRWTLLGLDGIFQRVVTRLELGAMLSFEVQGGNYCLVAGGHHLLALYLSLTGYDQELTSTNLGFGPSPRGSDVRTLHGQFTLRSSDGVAGTFSARKDGYLSPIVVVCFERGRIVWDGLNCIVRYIVNLEARQYALPSEMETIKLPTEDPFQIAIEKSLLGVQAEELPLGIATSRLLLKIMTHHFDEDDSTEFPVT